MHLGDSRIERVRIRGCLAMLTVRVVDLEYSCSYIKKNLEFFGL